MEAEAVDFQNLKAEAETPNFLKLEAEAKVVKNPPLPDTLPVM